MATKKKAAKKAPQRKKPVEKEEDWPEEETEEGMTKAEIEKLNDAKVEKLKGKLVEIRRVGASPIYVEVLTTDTIANCLEKGDIPTDDEEIKLEGMAEGKAKWESVKLSDKAIKFKKIVVTTQVRGSY